MSDADLVRATAREFLAERQGRQELKDLAALDWTGLLVDESRGGSGWLPVEATVIAEELGRAGDRTAWTATVVAAAALAHAPEGVRARWLPAALEGTMTPVFGFAGDTVLSIGADHAQIALVVDVDGIDLIDLSAATRRALDEDLLDVARPVYRIDVRGLPRERITSAERAEELLATARVLLSADSVGAVSMTLSRLTCYLQERTAFGAPIASFQAVQHRLVELLVFEVKARAAIMKAARALAAAHPRAATLAAVAHAFVAAKATAAVDECMQLSGGIGFTWEYPLHHELRRVFTNAYLLGTARRSRSELLESRSL